MDHATERATDEGVAERRDTRFFGQPWALRPGPSVTTKLALMRGVR